MTACGENSLALDKVRLRPLTVRWSMGEYAAATSRGRRPLVLFTVSSGWAIRNFFHTGLVSEVSAFADIGVAAASPLVPFFEDLHAAGVVASVVVLPSDEYLVKKRVRQAKKVVLQARHNISTANIQWRRRARSGASRMVRSPLWWAGRILAANWQITLLESVERGLPSAARLPMDAPPSLMINCSPFHFSDNELQRQLQRQGVPAVAVIPSWDNPSSKGCILSQSDWVFAWGDYQKEELRRYYPSIAPDRILISGVPQFDLYRQDLPKQFERSPFLASLSIDPACRVILYATGSPRNQPSEPFIVSEIARAIRSGRFGSDAHLLVRCHPADDEARYREIAATDRVTIFPPSAQSAISQAAVGPSATGGLWNEAWVPPTDETLVLTAMLRHSDVCINVASTMTLDAAACGTPTINVRFDGDAELPYLQSVRRYYDHEHYRPVTRSAAAPIVDSAEELLRAIDDALALPDRLADHRRALVERLCFQPEEGSVSLIARQIQRIMQQSLQVGRA